MLKSQCKDFVHAFVCWFDVVFNACRVPLTLTTSPRNKYTHWKQTVFYIQDDIAIDPGDVITGMIAVRKSKNNHRNLDVKITYKLNGKTRCSLATTLIYRF